MRQLYTFLLLVFSFSAVASHLRGGEISWECLGNGQYVFYLTQYRDCISSAATLLPTASISGPQGNISLSLYDLEDISPQCSGGASLGCNSMVYGGMEVGRFKSLPITLAGTPPPSGWHFYWNSCCRQSSLVNINSTGSSAYEVRATMYPGSANNCSSSPKFAAKPAVAITDINQSLSTLAFAGNASDSLYYRFVSSTSTNGMPVSYNTGYSATSPFPSSTTNPLNGSTTIDHFNGLINVDIKAATNGLYSYTVQVEQWQNNILISEVVRDLSVVVDVTSQSNNAPFAAIDTSQFQNMTYNGSVYSIDALPGDTVYFEMIANDVDYNIGANRFQEISLDALGRALDTNWGGVANYNSKPLLNPVAPQVGFSSQLVNKISFQWAIAPEHFSGTDRPHIFYFRFQDDQCLYPGETTIMVEVNVGAIASIQQDTVNICQGDSAQLDGATKSGQYQWSPASGLSSAVAASPLASPAGSRYYFLTDPQNPGFKDSVYVGVTPKGTFDFSFNNGQLQLTDSAQTTVRVWYYNGIPFSYPYDTLTPFGLGDYYVIGKSGGCQYISDTVSITMGMSFSVSSTGNGSYNGSPMVITGSQGVTFQVNQNVNVSWVSIPGIYDLHAKTGGYDLKLQVFDNKQTEIFSKDFTLAKPIDDVVRLSSQFSLSANMDYTIAISGDTGYAFSMYENMTFPATPHNVGITVKSVAEGGFGQFPNNPTNYMVPVSLGIDQTVDLNESAFNNWDLYPNPASGQVYISGLKEAKTVEVIDVNGKVVRSISVDSNDSTVVIGSGDLSSGLYIIKVHFENSVSARKVLFQ